MSLEIELKFSIASANLYSIMQLPSIKKYLTQKTPELYYLNSVYWDTKNLDIFQLGYGVRVRNHFENYQQTIKSVKSQSTIPTLHSRYEWNHQIMNNHPNFSFPEIQALEIPKDYQENIIPLFATNFSRLTFLLSPKIGVLIELAVDDGMIIPLATAKSQQSIVISEIELELIQGEAEELIAFANELGRQIEWQPELSSKAEKGLKFFYKV